jgi:predicted metal-dependent peptidase
MDEEVRKKITRARSQLIMHKNFWGYLACYLEPKEDKNLLYKTAGVDGKYLYYDPDFIRELDMEYLQGLIAHEVFHAAFSHVFRRGARDPFRWNWAADCVANSHLLAEGFKLPSGGLMVNAPHDVIEEARKLSVEEAYEKIKVEKQESGGQGKGGNGTITLPSEGDVGLDGELLDDHDVWDRAGDGGKSELEKSQSKKELEQRWREYVSRARQLVKSQGKGMGNMDELIDELLEPKMNWREWLRNLLLSSVISDYQLCPPSKRHIWRGIYLPSTKKEEEVEVVFVTDTCLRGDMKVTLWNRQLKEIRKMKVGDIIVSYSAEGVVPGIVRRVVSYAQRPILRIELKNGKNIYCTPQHHFLTQRGWIKAESLNLSDIVLQYTQIQCLKRGIVDEIQSRQSLDRGRDTNTKGKLPYSWLSKGGENAGKVRHFNKGQGCKIGFIYKEGQCHTQNETPNNYNNPFSPRGGLYCRLNRWGRDSYNCPQENSPEVLVSGTRDSDFKLGYQDFQLASGEGVIQQRTKASLIKTTPNQDIILRSDSRFPYSSLIRNDRALAGIKKKTMPFINRILEKTGDDASTSWLRQRRCQDILAGETLEFEPVQIREINPANSEEVFDLVTTTGNYLVEGIVCHNSGSMSTDEIRDALSEVVGITNQFGSFRIFYTEVDWDIQRITELTPYTYNLDEIKKVRGRGGTRFPVQSIVSKVRDEHNGNPSAIIYFTDSFGDVAGDDPGLSVFWLVCQENERFKPEFGTVVRYERSK